MRTRAAFAAFVLAGAGLVSGCHPKATSGPVSTQDRVVSGFTHVVVRAPARVDVHEGRAQAVRVTYAKDAQRELTTRVEGDTLVIDAPSHVCFGFCNDDDDESSARVSVELPTLTGVEIDGAGDVYVDGAGDHARFDIQVEGSGDLHYTGNAEVVRCSVEGSGDVVLEGKGRRLEAKVEGSGDIDARAFPVNGGAFDIEGSGDVFTDLQGGEATLSIHGSGDFHYAGEARFTHLDLQGSGDVERVAASE
jgi:hypothetical protein